MDFYEYILFISRKSGKMDQETDLCVCAFVA